MPDYDKLAAQFGGSTEPDEGLDKYELAARKFGGVTVGSPATPAAALPPANALQRAQAVGAGVNKGLFSDLVGIPVDTVANVLDMGKAGIGYVTSKITHKPPPEWTAAMDRSKVVGTSDWIAQKISDGADAIGVQSPVAPARPDDKTSRILYAGGRGAGMALVPSAELSGAAQLANMAKGGVSGLTAGSVAESNPEWAGVAGMIPQLAGNAGAAGLKYAVRGREAGRQAMAQRMADLQAGGISSPSVGLASGNKIISGLENLLSQTPGSMGLYDRAHASNVAGMQAKAEAIRDAISPEYGPVVAGEAIQDALQNGLRNRIKTTGEKLSNRTADLIGRDTVVPVDATLDKATRLTTPVKGAEATTGSLILPRIASIADNLRADVFGARPQVPSLAQLPATDLPTIVPGANSSLWNTQPRSAANTSLWNTGAPVGEPMPQRSQVPVKQDIPFASVMNAQKERGIPFGALKSLRTSIGDEAASNAIMGTPEQGQFKQLYGAMSDDMRNAAALSDAKNGIDPASTASATSALSRTNTFYNRGLTRAEDLNGLANRETPEGAYGAVASSLKSGPTIYERLRGAITPEARQKVVATVVNDMGAAAPGQQNADGTTWSARAFLTNYNRLNPDARSALFTRLPGGQAYADNLSKVAKAAEMMGDSSKVWANPSGTSHALAARGAAGTIGLGVVGGLFYHPLLMPAAAAGGSMIGANATSRLLLNQKFVNWLAKAPAAPSTAQTQAYAQRLLANAKLSGDKQFQQDATDYINALQAGGQ